MLHFLFVLFGGLVNNQLLYLFSVRATAIMWSAQNQYTKGTNNHVRYVTFFLHTYSYFLHTYSYFLHTYSYFLHTYSYFLHTYSYVAFFLHTYSAILDFLSVSIFCLERRPESACPPFDIDIVLSIMSQHCLYSWWIVRLNNAYFKKIDFFLIFIFLCLALFF